MRIALDLEGVLAGTHQAFVERYNTRFDTSFSVEDIDSWDLGELRRHFNRVRDLDESNKEAFLEGHGDWEGFLEVTERIWRENPGEIPALFDEFRIPEGATVDIVTARRNVRRQLLRWLEANGIRMGESFETLKVRDRKHRLDYDVFIDDNPELHRNLERTEKTGIVVEQPWNRELETGSRRVQNVEQIAEVIRDLG